jgi:hypothetical protein
MVHHHTMHAHSFRSIPPADVILAILRAVTTSHGALICELHSRTRTKRKVYSARLSGGCKQRIGLSIDSDEHRIQYKVQIRKEMQRKCTAVRTDELNEIGNLYPHFLARNPTPTSSSESVLPLPPAECTDISP